MSIVALFHTVDTRLYIALHGVAFHEGNRTHAVFASHLLRAPKSEIEFDALKRTTENMIRFKLRIDDSERIEWRGLSREDICFIVEGRRLLKEVRS